MITAIAITITTVVLRLVISSYLLGYNRGRDGRKRNEQAIRELAIEKLEQENKHDQI